MNDSRCRSLMINKLHRHRFHFKISFISAFFIPWTFMANDFFFINYIMDTQWRARLFNVRRVQVWEYDCARKICEWHVPRRGNFLWLHEPGIWYFPEKEWVDLLVKLIRKRNNFEQQKNNETGEEWKCLLFLSKSNRFCLQFGGFDCS